MESNSKNINWEKISAYFSGLGIFITLWSFLNLAQRDTADIRERVAMLEVKVEKLEEK